LKLVELYPNVRSLAEADDDELMGAWKGLGYYNRARNLKFAAQTIMAEFGGHFPTAYDDILSLKGIGPYTAAAIASFAYGLPYPVVDGNVFRVLSRYFGMSEPIDSGHARTIYGAMAAQIMDPIQAGEHNQAMMNFGALVCKPRAPLCDTCPLQGGCAAFRNDQVLDLPIKIKKTKISIRHFYYLIVIRDDQVFLQKRTGQDVWRGLYEPILIEAKAGSSKQELSIRFSKRLGLLINPADLSSSIQLRQQLSHQLIHAHFYRLGTTVDLVDDSGGWKRLDELDAVGMPRVVDGYFKDLLTTGQQSLLF
ncbi:MAG: NUDIX domain-containing protein, partial [Bacteroidota bacterium]